MCHPTVRETCHAGWFHGGNLLQGAVSQKGWKREVGEVKRLKRTATARSCRVSRAKWGAVLGSPGARNRGSNPPAFLFLPPPTPTSASHWLTLTGKPGSKGPWEM